MASLSRLGESNGDQTKRDLRWSRSEKAIARKACDAALKRELQELMDETKRRADRMKKPSELWDLERLLTERRRNIDRKYDPRYSHLAEVLGRLLHEKRLSEEDLRGLGGDKLDLIRSFARFLAESIA